jgi:hypothetical protein
MRNYRNNYDEPISKWYSWPVILIALLLCFPVGMFLIYRRLKVVPGSGKGAIILGAFFLFGAISCLEGSAQERVYSMAAVCLIIGLPSVYWGVKAIKYWRNYDPYAETVNFKIDVTVHSDEEHAEAPPKQVGTSVVRCPNCGANNTVTNGFAGVCEYCGAAIQS